MSKFADTLEGAKSPYYGQITIASERGDVIVPDDQKFPPLVIDDSHLTAVKSLHIQVVKVRDPVSDESAYVRRIVAEMDNGHEMDITDPVSQDADLAEFGVDTTKCGACGLPLDASDLVLHEGGAYHNYCMVETEEEDEGAEGSC